MTDLQVTRFDDESATGLRLSFEKAQEVIAVHNMQPIDVAITGARVYMTMADMLGGHLKQATFADGDEIVTMSLVARPASDSENFVSNEVDRTAQMELGDAIIAAFDEAVDERIISGYMQGALMIAALRVLYLGVKDNDIKELRFRHSKQNYVCNVNFPSPEENKPK